jgi:D-glycero-alpha-D-manno-heptose-7-phosphate kinase
MQTLRPSYLIKSRAPLRLGLAGGGTDVSPYCDEFGGLVLNATLDRYAYCILKNTEGMHIRFESTDLGIIEEYSIEEEINFTGPLDLIKSVYLEFVNRYCDGILFPVSVHTFCDSPMGSGLGSSSTLVVTIIKAFTELLNVPLDDYEIASLSFYIERVKCGHHGGRQDQFSATFGGFNYMEFYADNKSIITPLRIKNWITCNLESTLLLFYSGISRKSALVIDEQSENILKKNERSIEAMHGIKSESIVMKEALLTGNFDLLVECLRNGWKHKKDSAASVSTILLDKIYDSAISAGALAGKISGAGGGGFMMFYVPVEQRMSVINSLNYFSGVVSNCHFTNEGVQSWTVY